MHQKAETAGLAQAEDAVLTTTVDDGNYKSKLVYLNKQNRNTRAALIRSRSKVIHPHGRTYAAGRNKAKREARAK